MDESRLTKKAFLSDYTLTGKSWCSNIYELFEDLGLENHYENLTVVCQKTGQGKKLCQCKNYIKFKNWLKLKKLAQSQKLGQGQN